MTLKDAATLAANRFAEALADLDDPHEVLALLFKTVNAFTNRDGHHYTLMVSHPPTLDPQVSA